MKTRCLILLALLLMNTFGAENVYWYNMSWGKTMENSPGPGLAPDYLFTQKIVTGARSQQTEVSNDGFALGNGSLDNAGWCSFFWSASFSGFHSYIGFDSAKIRGEYRNGFSGVPQCNAGALYLRVGVADFQRTLSHYNGSYFIPLTAVWSDTLNPLQYNMGFMQPGDTLAAEQTIRIDVPASGLDQQFFNVDVTPQIQWIMDNGYSGEYAIVFLTNIGSGSPGKITLYAQEDETFPTPGSAAHWTTDGNTMHLLVYGQAATTGVTLANAALPDSALLSASPNPFNPATTISLRVPVTVKNTVAVTSIDIYGINGGHVRTLAAGPLASGLHQFQWDATDNVGSRMPSGCYLVRAVMNGKHLSQRISLLR
ncbi:MAG: FlgD immunoglobulin-like domain containing protein [Fibrobacterota bacterium]